MSTASAMASARLAATLNAACRCIAIDRDRLHARLAHDLGDAGPLLESRPGLVSGSVVFVDPEEAAAMDRTSLLVHRALASPVYRRHIEAHAPPIGRLPRPAPGGVLGVDFHLGGSHPQLIEINTNPGGLVINLALARALAPCCDEVAGALATLAAGAASPDALPARIIDAFRAEWASARGAAPLTTVAIVDDEPAQQYLYPEFLLYQRLFERTGWHASIVDPDDLEIRDGSLVAHGRRIDLVYNRLTDFYLAESRHAALRQAYESDLAVITPHPAAHARWADKRLLAWLRDEALLRAAGLDAEERGHLLRTIPPTEIVEPAAAHELWRRRKELFFKPVDGYGSKATYRGDGLTHSTFERILAHRYVAQALVPASMRRVIDGGETRDLRIDVRNYCSQGATWLRAARLYRGQTTNFRTPGGGFAPVLVARDVEPRARAQ